MKENVKNIFYKYHFIWYNCIYMSHNAKEIALAVFVKEGPMQEAPDNLVGSSQNRLVVTEGGRMRVEVVTSEPQEAIIPLRRNTPQGGNGSGPANLS